MSALPQTELKTGFLDVQSVGEILTELPPLSGGLTVDPSRQVYVGLLDLDSNVRGLSADLSNLIERRTAGEDVGDTLRATQAELAEARISLLGLKQICGLSPTQDIRVLLDAQRELMQKVRDPNTSGATELLLHEINEQLARIVAENNQNNTNSGRRQ